jgi:hypothetical protein
MELKIEAIQISLVPIKKTENQLLKKVQLVDTFNIK